MPTSFDSDRTWDFAVSPGELWERVICVDDYRSWWPWLRRFDPGGGLAAGQAWRCEVAPPLPYAVRFEVHLDRVRNAELVEATVRGDVRGRARLVLESDGSHRTRARLVSSLAPAHPMLRGFGRVARPLVEWGHDWVLDQGRRQFVERAGDPDSTWPDGTRRDR